MLITSLSPLLARYALGCDLVAGPDGTVTMTILPRKAAGSKHDLDGAEVRPISITGTAAEIDAELARGTDGALGQLITSRKALADQIAEQREETAKAAAATKAKAPAKPAKAAAAEKAPEAAVPPPPAEPKPGEPVSLY